MADFKTHLMGAAAASGVVATGLMMAGMASNDAVAGYFVLGVIGGLLPDIDSATSIPVRIASNLLAVAACFLLVFHFGQRYSLLELVMLWLACYLAIRYGIFTLFAQLTVHRGLIHSIPAGLAAGLLTTLLAHRGFAVTPLQAWMCGTFVCIGFMVHLLLDEFYSVNLMGIQVKSSFGTACRLGSTSNPYGTVALYAVLAVLFYLCPPPDAFLRIMLNSDTYRPVVERLLPADGWFDGLFEALHGKLR